MHVRTCTYFLDQSANSISSRGDYSRAASISFRACSGAATIRERRLFERGVYSVIYGTFMTACMCGRCAQALVRGRRKDNTVCACANISHRVEMDVVIYTGSTSIRLRPSVLILLRERYVFGSE